MELPYLDAVCRETLRLYPPVSFVIRTVCQDVVLPLSAPVRGIDGHMMHDVLLAKNSKVVIGMLASNRNPALWGEDSYEWKPERWLSPLPKAVTEARIPGIYSNLLSFIGGGRACIGFKFSQLEMKVVLAVLLECLTFSPSDKAIVWNHASVQYPTVGWTSTKAELPIVVEFSGKVHVG
ncbi:hypothetical protein A0H81_06897 [Grifola frondosa]|uniref:Cytochrome P450 n=1 Tax=Grifola frondosa TaxID=5627 RepID=A0A1C7M9X1_GRIFR|nr:hypothetical protein A0H81_06897 [Grifola frondosa]